MQRRIRSCLAFSLVEVMVAVGLLAVIIVGLLAMFYQTQRAFRAGMTQVDVLEKGRATMELIARELQESSASFETIVTNMQVAPAVGYVQPALEVPGGPPVNAMIQNVSFLRRVGYEWIGETYQVSNAVSGVGTLYRLLVVSNWTDVGPVSEAVHTAIVNPTDPTKVNTNFTPVADGIVHFRVLPLDGLALPMTNSASVSVSQDRNSYWFYSNGLPSFCEIELAVLEPRSVDQFRARATNPQKATAYLQKQAGRIHFFKQRVSVRNGPTYFAVTNVP